MDNIKEMVNDLAPSMKIKIKGTGMDKTVSPRKSFVVKEPLKHESVVSFVVKSDLRKVDNDDVRVNNNITESYKKAVDVVNNSALRILPDESMMKYDLSHRMPNTKNIQKAISKVSNMIKEYLSNNDLYEKLESIPKKDDTSIDLYVKLQNSIYHSLMKFCQVGKNGKSLENSVDLLTSKITPTLWFFDIIYNDRKVSYIKDPMKVMDELHKVYGSDYGIQIEWLGYLKERIQRHISISDVDLVKIMDMLDIWVIDIPSHNFEAILDKNESDRWNNKVDSTDLDSDTDDEEDVEELEVMENPEDESDESNDENNILLEKVEESSNEAYLSVSIFEEKDIDVIKVESSDAYGTISIPFYKKLTPIPVDTVVESIVDKRNGKWDWLINFVPDLLFVTDDPDKYLVGNDADENIKCIIMDKQNRYVIGVYYVESIVRHKEDGTEVEDYSDETLWALNHLVNVEIGAGYISHLQKSLKDPSLFIDESEISNNITDDEDSDIDDEIEDDDEDKYSKGTTEILSDDELAAVMCSQNIEDRYSKGTIEDSDDDRLAAKISSIIKSKEDPSVEQSLDTKVDIAVEAAIAELDEQQNQNNNSEEDSEAVEDDDVEELEVMENTEDEDDSFDASNVNIKHMNNKEKEDFTFKPIQKNKHESDVY